MLVHPLGDVMHFHYNGQKAIEKKPLWPSDIVEENVVLESLKARQDMRLVFVDLTHSSCEYENGEEVKGYRLVYEPEPSHAFIDASTGKDLFGPDHYRIASTVPVVKAIKNSERKDVLDLLDWDKEKFIKVDEKEDRYEIQMRFVLEKELQKERKEKDAYSMEEFYRKYSPILKHDNFVVITLDKETNQLLSCLMWTDERERKTLLSRDQCLDKALQFLEHIIPDATNYVQLWDNYEKEDGIERFSFSIYVNDIQVEGKYIMININTENGAVMHYSGSLAIL
ncbi:YcdB/YcdC domain-containing protein [Bacillus pacificus]